MSPGWSRLNPALDAITLESADFLLQESGNLLLVESTDFIPWTPTRGILLESGDFLLMETDNFLLQETFISPTSWVASDSSAICWAQLSTDTRENDVDFILSASSQFPMCVSSNTARALSAYSSIISSP